MTIGVISALELGKIRVNHRHTIDKNTKQQGSSWNYWDGVELSIWIGHSATCICIHEKWSACESWYGAKKRILAPPKRCKSTNTSKNPCDKPWPLTQMLFTVPKQRIFDWEGISPIPYWTVMLGDSCARWDMNTHNGTNLIVKNGPPGINKKPLCIIHNDTQRKETNEAKPHHLLTSQMRINRCGFAQFLEV